MHKTEVLLRQEADTAREQIQIEHRKEVRQFFNYGCHTICSMNQTLSDINNQNSSDLILEAI